MLLEVVTPMEQAFGLLKIEAPDFAKRFKVGSGRKPIGMNEPGKLLST